MLLLFVEKFGGYFGKQIAVRLFRLAAAVDDSRIGSCIRQSANVVVLRVLLSERGHSCFVFAVTKQIGGNVVFLGYFCGLL